MAGSRTRWATRAARKNLPANKPPRSVSCDPEGVSLQGLFFAVDKIHDHRMEAIRLFQMRGMAHAVELLEHGARDTLLRVAAQQREIAHGAHHFGWRETTAKDRAVVLTDDQQRGHLELGQL